MSTARMQDWREPGPERRWPTAVCPFCAREGLRLCGWCLRWTCREHAAHTCRRVGLPVVNSRRLPKRAVAVTSAA